MSVSTRGAATDGTPRTATGPWLSTGLAPTVRPRLSVATMSSVVYVYRSCYSSGKLITFHTDTNMSNVSRAHRHARSALSIGHGHRHTRRGGVQSQHTRAPTAASVAAAAPAMTTATWAVSGRGSIQLPAPPLRTNIQRIHEVDDESCGTSSSGLQ